MRSQLHARGIPHALALLVGYVGLIVWLTWPLGASLWSAMPMARLSCMFDMYYSAWALGHESRALVGAIPFGDGGIYYPASHTFFYGPAGIGALPLFAPVFLATGNPGLALNVTFILGLALTGAAVHWVVQRWTGSDLAGIVGATTVVLNQWLIWGFVPTAPHWAPFYGIPLIAFVASTRLHTFRSALWLVPLIALQCLVDLVYVAPVVVAAVGVLAALLLLRRRTRGASVRLITVLGLAVLVLLPVYRGYTIVKAENPALATQTKWTVTEGSYPSFLPARLLHGPIPFLITPAAMTVVPLGLVALLWRRRLGARPPSPGGWTQGALWTVVGGLLSLTPLVFFAGRAWTTPIGYALQWVPALQAIRVPSRLGVAGLVGLGMLSGVAFGEIVALLHMAVRRRALELVVSTALAMGAVAFVYRAYAGSYWEGFGAPAVMPTSYRLQATPIIPPTFVPILAASRAPVLELPVGVDGLDPTSHALAMFHAITHQRPVLNGYASYWPAAFPERMAEAARLPAQPALDHLVESTGLGLVWVHMLRMNASEQAAWSAPPAPEPGHPALMLVAREGAQRLFLVTPPAAPVASAH